MSDEAKFLSWMGLGLAVLLGLILWAMSASEASARHDCAIVYADEPNPEKRDALVNLCVRATVNGGGHTR